jgi:hypothetical protein
MMPPVCTICGKQFDPAGDDCGLVYFSLRESDIEWDRKMEETHMVGHPPYAAWFCADHFKGALDNETLTIDEAMPKIMTFYGV